jgi:hypothetical protein
VVTPEKCSAYDMQLAIVNQMNRFYSLKRTLTAYRSNRAWRIKYRLGGHILMRRWVKENKRYIENLRSGFQSDDTEIKGGHAAIFAPLGAATK